MTIQILKRRSIEVEQQQMVGIGGEFRLVVSGADGKVRRDTGWFKNLILDTGLNRMGSDQAIAGCAIGTSATPAPAVTDTALAAHAQWTTNVLGGFYTNSGASPYAKSFTRTIRFNIGSLNGNYSEIGVGWLATNLFSRALIVDSAGAPLAITVGSAEQLDVSYRVTAYHQTADSTQTVTISGVSYTITARPANASGTSTILGGIGAGVTEAISQTQNTNSVYYNGAMGLYTGTPSGSSAFPPSSATRVGYVNNSLYAESNVTFPTSSANLAGGISSALIGPANLNGAQFQFGFSPAIPKTSDKTLSLTFRVSWARRP